MAIKPFQNGNSKKSLESRIRDSQQNLYEFTLMTTCRTDLSCFDYDVLSVTRADTTPRYTNQIIHRKVNTQAVRVAAQTALVIPWPKRRLPRD